MNFNIEKAKELLKVFGKLNQENQNALLAKAFEMELEQNFRSKLKESGKPETEENLEELRGGFLDMANPLMEHWDDMEPNHHAALAILMNDMTKGELTKEESIDFVVSSRQLSISEYIENIFLERILKKQRESISPLRKLCEQIQIWIAEYVPQEA